MPGAVRIAADDTHGPEHAGALGTETAKVFFGITTRQAFRRGTFRFVKNLTSATGRFIDA